MKRKKKKYLIHVCIGDTYSDMIVTKAMFSFISKTPTVFDDYIKARIIERLVEDWNKE
jgi:hypothetical protein